MRQRITIGKILGEAVLENTASRLARVLGKAGIPHLIVGGYALQVHGYARFTYDVDVIVPDVAAAYDLLSIQGFATIPGTTMSLRDRLNHVTVDLLPGGKSVGPSLINLPMPEVVSTKPQIVTIESLMSQKLSSYSKNKFSRGKDLGDAQQLMILNRLPRTLAVDPAVVDDYLAMWDGYHQEQRSRAGS